MNKFFKGFTQFFIIAGLECVVLLFVGGSLNLLAYTLQYASETSFIARLFGTGLMADTMAYTFVPIASAAVLAKILSVIYHGKLMLAPVVSVFTFMVITNTIALANAMFLYGGILSWSFLNMAWRSFIYCGLSMYLLWKMTGYNQDKQQQEYVSNVAPLEENKYQFVDGVLRPATEQQSTPQPVPKPIQSDIQTPPPIQRIETPVQESSPDPVAPNRTASKVPVYVLGTLSIILAVALIFGYNYYSREVSNLRADYKEKTKELNEVKKLISGNDKVMDYISNLETISYNSDFHTNLHIIVVDVGYAENGYLYFGDAGTVWMGADNENVSLKWIDTGSESERMWFSVTGVTEGMSTIEFTNDANNYTDRVLVIVR